MNSPYPSFPIIVLFIVLGLDWFSLVCEPIHNLNNMNKSNTATNAHHNLSIKDYISFVKSRSKDKTELPHKKNKSPPRTSYSPKESHNNEEWIMMQNRYLELQQKYSDLLEIVTNRNCEYEKLKQQVQNYKKMHQRDTQQIEKLRCIIGLSKKKSVITQVDEIELEISCTDKLSRNNKFDQSTQDDIKMRQSGQKFNSKDKLSGNKLSRNLESLLSQKSLMRYNPPSPILSHKEIEEKNERLLLKRSRNQGEAQQTGRFNKKLSNSPYSKLRFVPGVKY